MLQQCYKTYFKIVINKFHKCSYNNTDNNNIFGGVILNNNFQSILNQLLNTPGGANAANELKRMDMSEIERRISQIDKRDVVNKLNSMNLQPMAQKLQGMSNAQIAQMLKNNPQIINL